MAETGLKNKYGLVASFYDTNNLEGLYKYADYLKSIGEIKEDINEPKIGQQRIIRLRINKFTQDHDNRIIQLEKTLQGIRELEELNSSNWRIHSRIIINKIADKYPTLNGINKYQATRHELYQRLNAEAHCNLEKRLQYRKERAYRAGASKKYIANISKLDVISEDVRLTNCAINVLKQMALEYGVYE